MKKQFSIFCFLLFLFSFYFYNAFAYQDQPQNQPQIVTVISDYQGTPKPRSLFISPELASLTTGVVLGSICAFLEDSGVLSFPFSWLAVAFFGQRNSVIEYLNRDFANKNIEHYPYYNKLLARNADWITYLLLKLRYW